MKEIVTASNLFAISIFFIYKSIRAGQAEFDLAWEWLTKKRNTHQKRDVLIGEIIISLLI